MIRELAKAARDKVEHIHLLLHSSGGLVNEGIGLYNYLRAYPIEVSIYNMSCLQSAAVTVYLGATRRIVGRHAKFMIHSAYSSGSAVLQQDEKSLNKILQGVRANNEMIRPILERHIKNAKAELSTLPNAEIWYSASQAVKVGIANSIGDFSPPKGTRIENFF